MMYRMFGRFAAWVGVGVGVTPACDGGASLSTPPHDASDTVPAIAAQTTRKRKACNGDADFFIIVDARSTGSAILASLAQRPKSDSSHANGVGEYAPRTACAYPRFPIRIRDRNGHPAPIILSRAVVSFFGSGAAAYALLAITFTNIKDAGGLPWLRNTLASGLVFGNFINTAILWGIALVFGLSVGSMMLKRVQSRFVYQLELIELTLFRRTLEAAGKNT
nr:hypothetical protein [Burkholderia cenocepacia]